MSKLYSQSFKTTTGLNKEYKLLRAQLIKALNLEGNVRFLPACFTLEMYDENSQTDINAKHWLPYTSDKATMKDRLNRNQYNLFRLVTAPLENMK